MIQEFYSELDIQSTIPLTDSYITKDSIINKPLHLIFHRGNVFKEMIEAFKSIDKQKCVGMTIELILSNGESEKGVDVDGVFRDAISEFWTTMYETCTVGSCV